MPDPAAPTAPTALSVTDCRVRYATFDDLETLVPLFDAYRVFYRQASDPAAARAYLQERFALRESVILLAETGAAGAQVPAGFVQLYPALASIEMRRQWILEDLYVSQDQRRHGVARQLMAAARSHALNTGAVRLMLTTAHDNLRAQALYESLGYTQDQVYRSYTLELG